MWEVSFPCSNPRRLLQSAPSRQNGVPHRAFFPFIRDNAMKRWRTWKLHRPSWPLECSAQLRARRCLRCLWSSLHHAGVPYQHRRFDGVSWPDFFSEKLESVNCGKSFDPWKSTRRLFSGGGYLSNVFDRSALWKSPPNQLPNILLKAADATTAVNEEDCHSCRKFWKAAAQRVEGCVDLWSGAEVARLLVALERAIKKNNFEDAARVNGGAPKQLGSETAKSLEPLSDLLASDFVERCTSEDGGDERVSATAVSRVLQHLLHPLRWPRCQPQVLLLLRYIVPLLGDDAPCLGAAEAVDLVCAFAAVLRESASTATAEAPAGRSSEGGFEAVGENAQVVAAVVPAWQPLVRRVARGLEEVRSLNFSAWLLDLQELTQNQVEEPGLAQRKSHTSACACVQLSTTQRCQVLLALARACNTPTLVQSWLALEDSLASPRVALEAADAPSAEASLVASESRSPSFVLLADLVDRLAGAASAIEEEASICACLHSLHLLEHARAFWWRLRSRLETASADDYSSPSNLDDGGLEGHSMARAAEAFLRLCEGGVQTSEDKLLDGLFPTLLRKHARLELRLRSEQDLLRLVLPAAARGLLLLPQVPQCILLQAALLQHQLQTHPQHLLLLLIALSQNPALSFDRSPLLPTAPEAQDASNKGDSTAIARNARSRRAQDKELDCAEDAEVYLHHQSTAMAASERVEVCVPPSLTVRGALRRLFASLAEELERLTLQQKIQALRCFAACSGLHSAATVDLLLQLGAAESTIMSAPLASLEALAAPLLQLFSHDDPRLQKVIALIQARVQELLQLEIQKGQLHEKEQTEVLSAFAALEGETEDMGVQDEDESYEKRLFTKQQRRRQRRASAASSGSSLESQKIHDTMETLEDDPLSILRLIAAFDIAGVARPALDGNHYLKSLEGLILRTPSLRRLFVFEDKSVDASSKSLFQEIGEEQLSLLVHWLHFSVECGIVVEESHLVRHVLSILSSVHVQPRLTTDQIIAILSTARSLATWKTPASTESSTESVVLGRSLAFAILDGCLNSRFIASSRRQDLALIKVILSEMRITHEALEHALCRSSVQDKDALPPTPPW